MLSVSNDNDGLLSTSPLRYQEARLPFKLAFYDAFQRRVEDMVEAGRHVIVVGMLPVFVKFSTLMTRVACVNLTAVRRT